MSEEIKQIRDSLSELETKFLEPRKISKSRGINIYNCQSRKPGCEENCSFYTSANKFIEKQLYRTSENSNDIDIPRSEFNSGIKYTEQKTVFEPAPGNYSISITKIDNEDSQCFMDISGNFSGIITKTEEETIKCSIQKILERTEAKVRREIKKSS